jgi:hypothetical protein
MRAIFKGGLLNCALAVFAVFALADRAQSERALPPETLTIGSENEGKIDASPQACLALVKEITNWEGAMAQRGARQVCAARKKHVEAYQALQATYKQFIQQVKKDNRFDWAEAAATVPPLVNTCIKHKFSITTGGHNIGIDIINNQIATACLNLATNLLRDETRELSKRGPYS